MSFTFSIYLDQPIRVEDVLRHLPSNVAWLEDLPTPDEAWPAQRFLHAYRPWRSTRTTEIGMEGDALTVRVMTLASPEDHQLAVNLVVGLSKEQSATVTAEDRPDPMAPSTVEEDYGAAWIADQVQIAADAILARVSGGATMQIPGPVRTFTIGPHLARRLDGDHDALFQVMRDVQHPDESLFVASVMTMSDDAGEHEVTLAVVAPGVRYMLPPVQFLAVLAAEPLHIPFDAASLFAPEHVTPLDERHLIVEPIEGEAWEAALERAQTLSIANPVEHVASGAPIGVLLPVLRPHDWVHRDRGETRPLFERMADRYTELPWISYAYDSPRSMAVVPEGGFGPETADPDRVHAAAVANLGACAIVWEEVRDDEEGRSLGLAGFGEFAAEALVSPALLTGLHERLESELLLVAVPSRGQIMVQSGLPVDGDLYPMRFLMSWARMAFEDARAGGRAAIAPYAFIVQEGVVSGLSVPDAGEE